MIEIGAAMGQGQAFSPPRPVKPEVFAEPAPAPPAPAEVARPPAETLAERPPLAPVVLPQAPAAPEARPERLPFRAVLRRASG
jgi:cyclic-di-GMP phosphodiesterase TipF (flagellum assembly factor)